MSYYNHRNYQLNTAERARAQAARSQAANIRNQLHSRMDRQSKEWQGSHGDPRSSVPNMMNAMSRENSSYHQEMGTRELEGQQAYANALNDEITQMQDRMADMSENTISSKNRSDEMAYDIERRRINGANELGKQQNNALSSLSNSLGSMDFKFETPQMPDTNLYNNDGERVGGSQYPSLFAKTGIKNSLQRA
jgi:hypothetical protein